MVVDMGSSRSINVMEFSWMEDGALIVTCKVLIPPHPSAPHRSAGCTGAFALFTNVMPGGSPPRVPRSLVSFVEAPRCPICLEKGSLGCYCSSEMTAAVGRIPDEYSSAIWPPKLTTDIPGTAIDTFHNVRTRLDLIQHIAHVKVTAHVVIAHEEKNALGQTAKTYKLGPSRFVIRSVLFRPSNSFEADTLRQVADKLRLLRTASVNLASLRSKGFQGHRYRTEENAKITEVEDDKSYTALGTSPFAHSELQTSSFTVPPETLLTIPCSETSRVSSACGRCGKSSASGAKCQMCMIGVAPASTGDASTRVTSTNDAMSRVTETPSIVPIPAKRMTCPLCDKTFSQQGSLNRHLKNIHEEKKIPCQFCPMTFGQMFDLKVRSHSVFAEDGETIETWKDQASNINFSFFVIMILLRSFGICKIVQRHQRRKHADKQVSNSRRERVNARALRALPD